MDLHLEAFKEFKEGNQKAYELLFKEFYSFLYSFALGYVREKHCAEDIVEDFFVDLWSNREKINISTSVRSYFISSIHNRSLNYLRRQKILDLTVDVADLTGAEGMERDMLIQMDAPSILTKELESALEKAIEKLPDSCREVFLLSRMDQLSYEQIADKMNISVNTVKYHIKISLNKLRFSMKEFLSVLIL